MLFLPDTPQLLKDEILAARRNVPLFIGRAMIEGMETNLVYWAKRRVDLPCLAIYGPAYRLTPEDRAAFKKTYPQCEYHEIDGVSHFFMLEIPYRTNQYIADFLSRHFK